MIASYASSSSLKHMKARFGGCWMLLGSTMAARHIAVLVAIVINTTAALAKSPTLGPAYHHGTLELQSPPLSQSGTVRIQSTSTASQAPPCSSDASCQMLCPTEDITAQQPALSTATAQQQVTPIACQCRASLPVQSVYLCGHAYHFWYRSCLHNYISIRSFL